jgi:hypothetical protein
MPSFDQSPEAPPLDNLPDATVNAELEEVLKTVPKGAFALAGVALGLLMLAWLVLYFFVFLPRGAVS